MKFIGSLGSSTIHSSVSNLRKISLKLLSRDDFIALQIDDVFVISNSLFFNRHLHPHQKKLLSAYAELEEFVESVNTDRNVTKMVESEQYVVFDNSDENHEPSITFHVSIKHGQAKEILRYLCSEAVELELSFCLENLMSGSNFLKTKDEIEDYLCPQYNWHTEGQSPKKCKVHSWSISINNLSTANLSLLEVMKSNEGLTEPTIRHFEKLNRNLSVHEKQILLLDRIALLCREIRFWILAVGALLLALLFR